MNLNRIVAIAAVVTTTTGTDRATERTTADGVIDATWTVEVARS
jgi:hypothetical protein